MKQLDLLRLEQKSCRNVAVLPGKLLKFLLEMCQGSSYIPVKACVSQVVCEHECDFLQVREDGGPGSLAYVAKALVCELES